MAILLTSFESNNLCVTCIEKEISYFCVSNYSFRLVCQRAYFTLLSAYFFLTFIVYIHAFHNMFQLFISALTKVGVVLTLNDLPHIADVLHHFISMCVVTLRGDILWQAKTFTQRLLIIVNCSLTIDWTLLI